MFKLNHKDQNGIAHWLLLLVFVAIFGLVGYRIYSTHAQTPPTPPPAAPQAVYGPKGSPFINPNGNDRTVQSASSTSQNCSYPYCFYYADAYQDRLTATGAYTVMSQEKPIIGKNDLHSLMEMAVSNSSGTQAIEVGWSVDKNFNGDLYPHLFVSHWVNGKSTCYNGCGFVASSSAPVPVGSRLTSGVTGDFQINYNSGQWRIRYNNDLLGYFPASIWKGTFTNTSVVKLFGEVCTMVNSKPHTQMGNGKFGTTAGSALFKSYSLLNSQNTPNLIFDQPTDPAAYNIGFKTAHGMNLGGPGYQ